MIKPVPGAGPADVIRRYVVAQASTDTSAEARYLNLLRGNFAESADAGLGFLRELQCDGSRISDADLTFLLRLDGMPEWRPRLTAAWLIGVDRRSQFRGVLSELLMASEVCFSGQDYCVALAAFGTRDDAELLFTYLDRYLPQVELRYDQKWALGALLYLDAELGTDYAGPLLAQDGPWHRWSTHFPGRTVGYDRELRVIAQVCSL